MQRCIMAISWLVLISGVSNAIAQETVSVANGQVSFEVPRGFSPMSQEEIAFKYPRGNPPTYAYANEDWTVSIAVTLSDSALRLDQLGEYQSMMEQMLPRLIPGLEWITREIVTISGQPWVHFEVTSFAIDTDIHNHMFMTSLDGRMLGINLNSTVEEYPAFSAAFARTQNSIRVVE